MTTPNALIADDEPLLRAQLKSRLSTLWPELNIAVEAANGLEAVAAFSEGAGPSICFLDIQMPGMSGLEAAQRIREATHRRTQIVFVTAFEEHALAAFERGAVDYVLKPFETHRLAETVTRLKEAHAAGTASPGIEDFLERFAATLGAAQPRHLQWIKASVGNTVRMIPVADVHYFHSDDKYTRVVTAEGEVLIRKPIKELINELDPAIFWQIHRATIVNSRAIVGVVRGLKDTADLRLRERKESLTVSRAFLHLFKQM